MEVEEQVNEATCFTKRFKASLRDNINFEEINDYLICRGAAEKDITAKTI